MFPWGTVRGVGSGCLRGGCVASDDNVRGEFLILLSAYGVHLGEVFLLAETPSLFPVMNDSLSLFVREAKQLQAVYTYCIWIKVKQKQLTFTPSIIPPFSFTESVVI